MNPVGHVIALNSKSSGTKILFKVNGVYQENSPVFVDAGDYVVEYKLVDDNEEDGIVYEEVEASVNVHVNKIDVKFELAEALDKAYDGDTVTPTLVIKNYDGRYFANVDYYLNGEYVAEARTAGTYQMIIRVVTVSDNYNITKRDDFYFTIGKTLSGVIVSESSLTKTYDGEVISPVTQGTIYKAYVDENGHKSTVEVVLDDSIRPIATYYKLVGNEYEELDYIPVDAGNYLVKFTLEETDDYQEYVTRYYDVTIRPRDIYFGAIIDNTTELQPGEVRVSFAKPYDGTELVIPSTSLKVLKVSGQKVEVETNSPYVISGAVKTISSKQNIYLYSTDFAFVNGYSVTLNGNDILSSNINVIFSIVAQISEAAATVTSTPYNGIYDAQYHGLTFVATDDVSHQVVSPNEYKIVYSLTGAENSYTVEPITYKEVGEYTVYYKVAFDNYATVTGHNTITITKATPTISIPTITRQYNGYSIVNPKVTTNTTGAYTYRYYDADGNLIVDEDGNPTSPIYVGSYTLKISLEADHNFEARTVSYPFEITECVVEIVWNNTTIPYSGYIEKPLAGIKESTFDKLIITVTTTQTDASVGTYTATASINNSNYKIKENTKSKEFNIVKNVVETPQDITTTYTGNSVVLEKSGSWTFELLGLDEIPVDSIINVGNYLVRYTLKDTVNYEWDNDNGSNPYTINLKVTALDLSVNRANISVNPIEKQSYTSYEVKPKPEVMYLSSILTENVDYTLTYSNNIDASAHAIVTINGMGNFKGSFDVEFIIYSTVLKLKDEYAEDLRFATYTNSSYVQTEDEAVHDYYESTRRVVLRGLSSGVTIAEFISMFEDAQQANIKFYNSSNRIVAASKYSTTLVGSGCRIQLYDGNTIKDKVYIVVEKDLNGDGLVNGLDQSVFERVMAGRTKLTYELFLAADLNHDGVINGIDLNLFYQ